MFQRRQRRFRYRSNDRDNQSHRNSHAQTRLRSNSFSNNHARGNFRSTQSAEKLLEKYNILAKEAISSGDRISGENYLQHADHFKRIVESKNKNKELNKANIVDKPIVDNKSLSENNDNKQEDAVKNKE